MNMVAVLEREKKMVGVELLPVQTLPTENQFGPSPTAFYGTLGTFSLPFFFNLPLHPFSPFFFDITDFFSCCSNILPSCIKSLVIHYTISDRPKLSSSTTLYPRRQTEAHHKTRIQWEDCLQSCTTQATQFSSIAPPSRSGTTHHHYCGPLDYPHRLTSSCLGVFSWRSSLI